LGKKKNTEKYKLELEVINKERGTNLKLKDGVEYVNNNTKIIHICTCGKEWDATPSNILRNTKSCGLCITLEDWCLSNNRQDILSRWDYKLNDKNPNEINYGTKKKYYFKCPKDIHKSELKSVYDFTGEYERNVKCNQCNSFKCWCLDNNRQDVLERWDYELNNKNPDEVLFGTIEKYYFKCPKGIHKSELKNISNFTSGQEGSIECNQCSSFAQYNINNIGEDFLEKYWDYNKNTVDPWEISYGSNNKVYIICQEKDYHESYEIICPDFSRGVRCSYCKGDNLIHPLDSFAQHLKNLYGNNALDLYWDYNKNNNINPWQIYKTSRKLKVYIKCQNKDYHKSYPITPSSFANGNRCPYCSHCNGKVHILDSLGFLYPESLEVWSDKNEKSPYKYAPSSNEKVYWKCIKGKHKDFPRVIEVSKRFNFRCPDCSYEQKDSIMATTLKQVLKYEYPDTIWEYDAGFRGLNGGVSCYDIFVPELDSLLIECQSEYHDNPAKQELDKLKKEYAINNSYNYLAMDKRDYTPLEAIQLFFSEIKKIPNYIDISKNTNFNWDLDKAQELLNEGYTYQEVADLVGATYTSLSDCVKRKTIIKPENYKIAKPNKYVKVVRLDKINSKIFKIYKSVTDAAIDIGDISYISNISTALNKRYRTAYGFKWMYYDEYIELNGDIKENINT